MSYSSVLSSSILSRRQALYRSRGFEIQRWSDLTDERRALRREIQRIAVDYDVGWKEGDSIKEIEETEKDDEEDEEEEKDEAEENLKRETKNGESSKGIMSN